MRRRVERDHNNGDEPRQTRRRLGLLSVDAPVDWRLLTLRTREIVALESLAQKLVELSVRRGAEVVVGLDVLLDRLTAGGKQRISRRPSRQANDAAESKGNKSIERAKTNLLPLRSLS